MSADMAARVAALERQVAALMRRPGSPFALARSTLTPNDGGPVQTMQGKLDALSTRDKIPVLFHYGFSSCAPIGADKLVAFIDGDRSKAVAFASNHQGHRLTGLASGESWLYNAVTGSYVKCGASGIVVHAAGQSVEVDGATTLTVNASTEITCNTPLLRCSGDIQDNYVTNARTMAAMRSIYDTHTHDVPDVQAGTDTLVTEVPNQQE
jgi:phage gp45-like